MHVEDIRKNWKDAFNCKKCAKKERTDCPCYLEWIEENNVTGEKRIRKGCLFQILPELLIQNTKVADGVHAALNSLRNNIIKALDTAEKLRLAVKKEIVITPEQERLIFQQQEEERKKLAEECEKEDLEIDMHICKD